ncbi:MAG: helix-turn-helix transcriptional regulator [Deltaproteobacteria bacterium]|nr:helix-turn-helix transcriptional regulator [Deltaproteobacteria bacterium]
MNRTQGSEDGASRADWTGTLFLSLTRAVYVGPARDTDPHQHHAIQICVALDEPFLLRPGPQQPWRPCRTAVIGADVDHQLDGRAARHVLIYLDPETPDGRRIVPPQSTSIAPLSEALSAALRESAAGAQDGQDADLYAAVSRCLALTPLEQRRLDPRVALALTIARQDPQRFTSVAAVAATVGLSPRRFRDLFARDTGIGCRRLMLWLRLHAAVRSLAHRSTLTESAYAAGFSDSAHLSRTFRAMFGIAPSALSRGVRFVDVED